MFKSNFIRKCMLTTKARLRQMGQVAIHIQPSQKEHTESVPIFVGPSIDLLGDSVFIIWYTSTSA